ncbi:MAG: sigma-70 family RNA polymerase sigma factor [Oscillospiraceae bacterium]|nr:sigma-70 family RNA polymerase sigma factor [Oscillospiraceae bacterium]
MSDPEILDLFFARDQRAIGALSERYGGILLHTARNIVRSREDAEECVNDAYLDLWEAIPPARPSPLLSYAAKVVRDLANSRLRYNSAQKRAGAYDLALDELSESLAGPDSVEERMDARALGESINAFLEQLDRKTRVLFVRRYWFSDIVAAIAADLGDTDLDAIADAICYSSIGR